MAVIPHVVYVLFGNKLKLLYPLSYIFAVWIKFFTLQNWVEKPHFSRAQSSASAPSTIITSYVVVN